MRDVEYRTANLGLLASTGTIFIVAHARDNETKFRANDRASRRQASAGQIRCKHKARVSV